MHIIRSRSEHVSCCVAGSESLCDVIGARAHQVRIMAAPQGYLLKRYHRRRVRRPEQL